jgi:hypothetical protein
LPLPKIDLAPRTAVGLAIGARQVCAARLTSDRDAWSLDWSRCDELDVPMFKGVPTPETVAALGKAISAACDGAGREYVPVHVSLPDPVAAFSVFELDELPKARDAQLNLVHWRFAKEHYGDERPLACACQTLGSHDGKQLLLGMALEATWRNTVREGLQRAGVVAWTMNTATCYRFNRFHPLFTAEHRGGALVTLDPDAWALALWDDDGRLRWLRGRWRGDSLARDDDDAYAVIAVDAERFILTYVHGGADRRVERVYVAGGDETAALTEALDRRLRERSIPLAAGEGTVTSSPDMNKSGHGLMDVALAAATGQ